MRRASAAPHVGKQSRHGVSRSRTYSLRAGNHAARSAKSLHSVELRALPRETPCRAYLLASPCTKSDTLPAPQSANCDCPRTTPFHRCTRRRTDLPDLAMTGKEFAQAGAVSQTLWSTIATSAHAPESIWPQVSCVGVMPQRGQRIVLRVVSTDVAFGNAVRQHVCHRPPQS